MTAELSIEEKNAQFDVLPDAEKRIAIAQDVLQALATNRLEAGCYYLTGQLRPVGDEHDSFQATLAAAKFPCRVCAKGAIFCATVLRRNQVSNQDADWQAWGGPALSRSLGHIFSSQQLNMMENEYETADMNMGGVVMGKIMGGLPRRERLEIIMLNVIRNGGTFIPSLQDPELLRRSGAGSVESAVD